MIKSRPVLIVLAITGFVFGCKPPEARSGQTPAPNTPVAGSNKPGSPAGGSDNNVAIVPMGGGGITPVTNTGAIEGGGSGIGQAAKNAAKSAAEKSTPTPSTGDGD